MSQRHREALAHLLYGVQGQGGFIVLTGEVGTGKTTICRCFLNQVPKNTDVAFIVNPKLSAHELLASICDEFQIAYGESASIKSLNDALNDYLLVAHANQRHTVLIIDEAQNLEPEVLEQLRLLTNLETSEKKLLQIILLGQPELRDMLARKELRQLAQRVTARYHLSELSRVEVGAYVACRLAVAGRKPRLFGDAAIKALYKFSGGIPRLINLLADRALLGAYSTHSETIEPAHIKNAHYEIQGEAGSPWYRFVHQYGYRVIGSSLALVLFVGLGLWSKPLLDSFTPYQEAGQNSSPVAESSDALAASGDSALEEVVLAPPSSSGIASAEDRNNLPVSKGQDVEAVDSSAIGSASPNQARSGTDSLGPKQEQSGLDRDVGQQAQLGPIADTQSVNNEGEPGAEAYIDNFAAALSSNPESLVAYVEAPTPDTRLFAQVNESTQETIDTVSVPKLFSLGDRQRGEKDKLRAFQAIFGEWQLEYATEPFRLACEFAQLNGLACLHKQGNWRSLLRIDRPAVLTLFNDNGQKIHLALLKIEGERALVAHNGEQFSASLDEIDRFWLGEYSVVWKLPPYKSGVIRPGQPDEQGWLEQGLSQINPDLKGLSLQEKVVEFQRAMGLVPDGIAGSMTLIQMNNLLDADTPKLLGNS